MSDKQFLVRITEEQHERIRLASDARGMTMADWFRKHALDAAAEVLDCQHPPAYRKTYPWSETCTWCGMRLR